MDTYFTYDTGNVKVFSMNNAEAINCLRIAVETGSYGAVGLGTHAGLAAFEWGFDEKGGNILCGEGCYSAFHGYFSGGRPLALTN